MHFNLIEDLLWKSVREEFNGVNLKNYEKRAKYPVIQVSKRSAPLLEIYKQKITIIARCLRRAIILSSPMSSVTRSARHSFTDKIYTFAIIRTNNGMGDKRGGQRERKRAEAILLHWLMRPVELETFPRPFLSISLFPSLFPDKLTRSATTDSSPILCLVWGHIPIALPRRHPRRRNDDPDPRRRRSGTKITDHGIRETRNGLFDI